MTPRKPAAQRCNASAGRIMTLLSVRLVPVCSIDLRHCNLEIATKGETMEVNGIAHIFLTASNYRTVPRILS